MVTPPDLAALREALNREFLTEWRCVCATQPSLLLEGPTAATEEALALIAPCLDAPVIVREVGQLSPEEQSELLLALEPAQTRTQIVATTTHSLFSLVEQGAFDATLYYRLNVIRFQIGSAGTATSTP